MCGNAVGAVDQAIGTDFSGQNNNSNKPKTIGLGNSIESNLMGLMGTASKILSPVVSYDPNTGKAGEGYASHWLDEAVGQATGRNSARDTIASNNIQAQQALDEQNSNLANAARQRMNNDVAASNMAGAVRAGAASISRNTLGFSTATSTPTSGDVLGL